MGTQNTKAAAIFFLFTLTYITSASQGQFNTVMKSFSNDRFGMFIHWGPVTLRGAEIGWSRGNEVVVNDYDSLYREFNPVLFNADEWVKAAKDAGMKYLVITARHHDGFCLWPTKFTDYNISNTPYKKDILRALADACKEHGLKFCVYYSVLDWHHPDYPIHRAHYGEWDEDFVNPEKTDPKSDMNRYIVFMKNQLRELIQQYNPHLLWFDGEWGTPWTRVMGQDLYTYIKEINPNVIVNGRIAKRTPGPDGKVTGDYHVYEFSINKLSMNIPWESCFNLCNQQWSWKANDNVKSLSECLALLSKTTGGNGNLLLNIGPMPDGRIEERQISRLREVGDWLKLYGDAVYGTLGGPYEPTDRYTTTRKENKIFIHVIKTDAPFIELKNIPGRKITKAHIMDGAGVTVEKGKETYKVTLPTAQTGKLEYVIVLEMDGNVEKTAVIK